MKRTLLALALVASVATSGWAITVDLSGTSDNGTINGATFEFHKFNPSGTGVFAPFVRIQATGQNTSEQGYNTDGTPRFETKSGTHTHSLLFSSLIATNGQYQFVLDIGEGGGADSLLSLDGLKFYSTDDKDQDSNSVDADGNASGITGTLLYDMDAGALNLENYVLLDANRDGNPGNGWSDMLLSIPTSFFDARVAGEDYIILWSRFGLTTGAIADNTFEEWAHISGFDDGNGGGGGGGNVVPEPGTFLLLGAGLMGLGLYGRKRITK